jgi:phosphatidylglycerophosphate synthase
VPETLAMNRRQRLVYFPSLHSNENKFSVVFKLVFEVVAKVTINWWALGLLWLAEKARQKWLIFLIKQIPNSLSFFRIVVIPVICINLASAIHANDHITAAHWFVIMVAVICLDAVDGPAARDLDAVSEFGARLDPASDKFCFFFIVLTYCVASLFEYSVAFCVVAIGLALWCLHVELKLIRLSVGPFRKLLKVLKYYNPDFTDPGAFLSGKIKFNLQMAACVIGWLGLIWFPADPTAILLMAIVLLAARRFGDMSLGMHRQEYYCLAVVAIWLQNPPRWGHSESNVVPIRKPA